MPVIRPGTARRLGLRPAPEPVKLANIVTRDGVTPIVIGVAGQPWAQNERGGAAHAPFRTAVCSGQVVVTRGGSV